jgi:hypothetical protein
MIEIKKYYVAKDFSNDCDDELYAYLQMYLPDFLSESKNDSYKISTQEKLALQEEDVLVQVLPNKVSVATDTASLNTTSLELDTTSLALVREKLPVPFPLYKNVDALSILFKEDLGIVGAAICDGLRGVPAINYNLTIKNKSLLDVKTEIEATFSNFVLCNIIEPESILKVFFLADKRSIQITPYVSPQCRDVSVNAIEYYPKTQELVYLNQSMLDFKEKKIAMFSGQNLEERLKSDINLVLRPIYYAAKYNFSMDEKLDIAIEKVVLERLQEKEKFSKAEKIKIGFMLRELFCTGCAERVLVLILARPHLTALLFGVSALDQTHALMLDRLCREMDNQYEEYLDDVFETNKILRASPPSLSLFFATLWLPKFLERLRVHSFIVSDFSAAIKGATEDVVKEHAYLISNDNHDFSAMCHKINRIWLALLKYHFHKTGFLHHASSSQQLSYEDFCDGYELWNAIKIFNFPFSFNPKMMGSGFFAFPTPLPPETVGSLANGTPVYTYQGKM